MALEVGTLVARIKLEGDLEQGIARAKREMDAAAAGARKLDDAVSKVGQSGQKVAVSPKARQELSNTQTAASQADRAFRDVARSGQAVSVSGQAKTMLQGTSTTARATSDALAAAGRTGRSLTVSDTPTQKLSLARQAADGLDTSLGKIGMSLGQLGTLAGLAGTAAGLAAINKQGSEYTNSLNTMGAVSQATSAQMEKVSDQALRLGSDSQLVGVSAGDAAQAMTELAKGGFDVEQSMNAARGSLQLAGAAQVSASEAATVQGRVLSTFNLGASEAGRVADVLANATNASAMELGDLALGLQAGGSVASQFGMSLEETASALAFFSNNGIKGSDAGTLLKTSFLSLTDTSKPALAAIDTLGLTVYDAQGKFVGFDSVLQQLKTNTEGLTEQEYQAATATLFGTDAFRMSALARRNGSADYDKLTVAMSRQGSAAELAAAKTKGLPGALNNLQNQAETAGLELYQLVDGPLASMATFTADGLEKAPAVLEGVANAAAPVGAVVGKAVSMFGSLPGPVQAATAALVAMKMTGLGDSMTGRIAATGGAFRSFTGDVNATRVGMSAVGADVGRVSASLAVLEQRSPAIARMGAAYRGAAAPVQAFAAQQRTAAEAARVVAMSGGDAFRSIDALGRQMGHTAVGQVSAFAGSLRGTAAAGLSAFKTGIGGVVGALGGPWMLGLAAAGMLIGDFVTSAQSASRVNRELAEAAADGAAAQYDLASALAKSNGEMDDTASAAAQRIVGAELDQVTTKAGQNMNMLQDLASAVNRTSLDYEGFGRVVDNSKSGMDRSAAATEMAKLEQQALADACKEAGISVDDVGRVAQEGGRRYDALKAALANTGDAGLAMTGKLESARAAIERSRAAAEAAEPGSYQLAEAFATIADSAATADEKTNALKSALDAMAGDQDAAGATQAHDDAIRSLTDSLESGWNQAEGFGDALIKMTDSGPKIDTVTRNGSMLRDELKKLRDTTAQVSQSGGDMDATWESNRATMQRLADGLGLTLPQVEQLARSIGLIPEVINTSVQLHNGGQTVAELALVATELEGMPEGKTITVPVQDQGAIDYLRSVGWQVKELDDGVNVEVTATTDGARRGLMDVAGMGANVENLDPNVEVTSNADWVTAALGLTKEAVEVLPGGHIEISDTTPENMERLRVLGVEVGAPKNGKVLVNSADVDRAAGHVRTLNTLQTSSQHRVNVSYSNPNFNPSGGGSTGYADGGIRQNGVTAFADGGIRTEQYANGAATPQPTGWLPTSAVIKPPSGSRGIVQWAENETHGEAFIPLAPSKRKRSLTIWEQVGKMLGALDPRPALGRIGGGIWNLAAHRDYDGSLSRYGIEEDNPLVRLGLSAFDARRGTNTTIARALPALFGPGSPIRFRDGEFSLSSFADGGFRVSKGAAGTPYVFGGFGPGGYDCSGFTSVAANEASGRPPHSERTSTAGMGPFLKARGFKAGRGGPGSLSIGWANGSHLPGGGHTALTYPDGTNAESRGGRGVIVGGDAWGADNAYFDQHMHLPIAGAGGQGKGGGEPKKDTRTPREKNIDAIVEEGMRRGMSDRDIQIALMTAEQESGTRVLNNPSDAPSMGMAAEGTGYDGTSTGIFQQQNNGAWGTLADRMDPTKSAGMFYEELAKVEGRDQMSMAAAAQSVQGSRYPEAYAKHEGKAAEMLSASKSRLSTMGGGSDASGDGDGQRVYVTNWPGGGGSYSGGSVSSVSSDSGGNGPSGAEADKDDEPEDTTARADAIRPGSIADMLIRATGTTPAAVLAGHLPDDADSTGGANTGRVQFFANGGFAGLENHTAHIAPAGSWRVFGEPETGGEAYIPLASNKRATARAVWLESGKRLGMFGAGMASLAASGIPFINGQGGLDTGYSPGMDDFGVDVDGLVKALSPAVRDVGAREGDRIAAQFLGPVTIHDPQALLRGEIEKATSGVHQAAADAIASVRI